MLVQGLASMTHLATRNTLIVLVENSTAWVWNSSYYLLAQLYRLEYARDNFRTNRTLLISWCKLDVRSTSWHILMYTSSFRPMIVELPWGICLWGRLGSQCCPYSELSNFSGCKNCLARIPKHPLRPLTRLPAQRRSTDTGTSFERKLRERTKVATRSTHTGMTASQDPIVQMIPHLQELPPWIENEQNLWVFLVNLSPQKRPLPEA